LERLASFVILRRSRDSWSFTLAQSPTSPCGTCSRGCKWWSRISERQDR